MNHLVFKKYVEFIFSIIIIQHFKTFAVSRVNGNVLVIDMASVFGPTLINWFEIKLRFWNQFIPCPKYIF